MMTVKTILFIIVAIGIFILGYIIIKNRWRKRITPIKSPITFTPENAIILFDLHDVIFTQDWAKTASILFGTKEGLIFMVNFLRPPFLFKALSLIYTEGSWKEFMDYLKKDYPQLLKHIPLMEAVVNAQKTIPQTVAIVKELKKKGYTLHIASNIGEQFFEHLKKTYPAIIDEFSKVKIIKTAPNVIVKKPGPRFFKEYLAENNPEDKHIVFIDNYAKSIKTAEKFGILGIKFSSPRQLKVNLIDLGILK